MAKFELFIGDAIVPKSICFDKDSLICNYRGGEYNVHINVRGNSYIIYKDSAYDRFDTLPWWVQNNIKDGYMYGAYENDPIYVTNESWYEISIDNAEYFGIDYDDVDISGKNSSDLEKICKDFLDKYLSSMR